MTRNRAERVEDKLAGRPALTFPFDPSGTTVRCQDGFARVRRDCVQLDVRWEYVGNSSAKEGAAQ